MENLFSEALIATIRKAPVIAVLTIDRAEDAVPLSRSLLRGGISAVELTLRTPAALDALDRIKAETPEITAGVGTILNPEQVRAVKNRNAAFGVSPGLNPQVVAAAKELGLYFAPGILTPSELESAYSLGCNVMKLFPAEPAGGLSYLDSINAPYAHLGIQYIPLGGVSQENLPRWLEHPCVLGVGGSWLAPRKLIQEKDWDRISRTCEKAAETAVKIRKPYTQHSPALEKP
ncbi:MAG: bifunctional 4-hydroxy-2-oxoglutarate aldolase/2-dehydro-3-deoxy-phosphogluconate aldolase [Spirochaetaceae bacterium]|jgi:2-dehydro-3-deoxyphosphogluconate aldolase/(4S)-4-hydroxy-2-oxoglutarate aldolase|nr:bifunctional 4-hydroxy-2-oxoglutarate aldolase/2-dehydro-3-deoxy-phosphogluconate aldolase [Spirochaetaceae bacterium]